MIESGDAMRSGLPGDERSHGWRQPGTSRCDTVNPQRPAFGLAPRPVAPSSRISPPEPVAAPGFGEIAVGWLCVSTLIAMCAGSCEYAYTCDVGSGQNQRASAPAKTAALSLYAESTPSGERACVLRIIANRLFGARSPSVIQSALKILCRQCSEFACANIMSSTSVGLRFSAENCSAR